MFVEERQRLILERLQTSGKVTVEELVGDFGVSAPTVRADLATLETRRLLRRTHGGALAVAPAVYEPPYAERAVAQSDEKTRIGAAAARLVQPGDTVILDAGTTTHAVGLALAARNLESVTVVTNNLPTALFLMDTPGIAVIVIGGHAQPHRRAAMGPLAAAFLAPFRADRLFLGVSGVDANAGFTAADFDAAQVKQAMIAHASQIIAVADETKIGQAAFAHIAPLSVADLLITDAALSSEEECALIETGLRAVQQV